MLFHRFSEAVHDTLTAQSSAHGLRDQRSGAALTGQAHASLTLQVWQRASDLHSAAQSRNNDGPLRFLEPSFANCESATWPSPAPLAACWSRSRC